MFFSEKGSVKTITIFTVVFFAFSLIAVFASHIWGPGQPGYLQDPLWPVGPDDLESRDKLVVWLKKPEIRAGVKEMYKSKRGAYEAIYDIVENHPEKIVLNAPASSKSNLGMLYHGDDPYIMYPEIVLSSEEELRVAWIGPLEIEGGILVGMQIPYKTVNKVTGVTKVSCYNIYGHWEEAPPPGESPTPFETPPSQKTPGVPPTPQGPTPSPTIPTISFPTPCRFAVSGQLQGGNTYQVQTEVSYETKKLLDFWGFWTTGESQTTGEVKATPTGVGTPITPGPTVCPSGSPNPMQTPGPTSVPTQVTPPPQPTPTPFQQPTSQPTQNCAVGTPTPGVNGPHPQQTPH